MFFQGFFTKITFKSFQTCADQESFARGGPTLTFFFLVDEGREDKLAIIAPPAKRHFKWRFAGGPMMAQH